MIREFDGQHVVKLGGVAGLKHFSSGRRRPFEANHLFQVLGYVLLDLDNRYAIGRVGWYFARQQERVTLPLPSLLDRLCGSRDIPALRRDFIAGLHT